MDGMCQNTKINPFMHKPIVNVCMLNQTTIYGIISNIEQNILKKFHALFIFRSTKKKMVFFQQI